MQVIIRGWMSRVTQIDKPLKSEVRTESVNETNLSSFSFNPLSLLEREPGRSSPSWNGAQMAPGREVERAQSFIKAFLQGERGLSFRVRAADLSLPELRISLELAPKAMASFRSGLSDYIHQRERCNALYADYLQSKALPHQDLSPKELTAVKKIASEMAHVRRDPRIKEFARQLAQAV